MHTDFTVVAAKKLLDGVPRFARRPLAMVPFPLKSALIARVLGLILAGQAREGELSFLEDKWVGIQVPDLALAFEVGFDGHWLVREMGEQPPAVTFMAESKELVLVAAGKEDPDTLFFQRRLCIEGDTELGLEVKNLLLSIEFAAMPLAIRFSIAKLAGVILRLQDHASCRVMPRPLY
ncbi:SCP2 sterol-binding domain-containing protein [Shewanella sp. AS16]|uniref:ubiquinone anaerobic biosynthesis accessory factor UbiT n=1 Tax=Shewanella sp. AS16 TaxID=2907625 RepID=UPI001F1DD338|nr:SCP2 sterol-binding domain-containing protein [Shewanella sp. AS16]MCE9688122.1 SCP2 sterol-binding domain-containing protein [Shewanella sp. AS16]